MSQKRKRGSGPVKYGPATVAKVIKVIDGDTFKVNLVRWPPIVGQDISVRIRGFNSAELRTEDEIERLKALRAQNDLRLLLETAGKIELYNIVRGKFFRLVADIYVDGKDIRPQLEKSQAMRLRVASQ